MIRCSRISIGAAVLMLGCFAQAQPCNPAWSRDFPDGSLYDGDVHALAVFDVAGQPRMFAAGNINYYPPANDGGRYFGWWDGTLWNKVGGVDPPGEINALLVWDDGSGPALYTGGEFGLARQWDGQSWSDLDNGFSGEGGLAIVRCLAVYDDGSGPALYAGGRFTKSADLSRDLLAIARWDGQHWQPLGGGLTNADQYGFEGVYTLTVHDDGGGSALYAGGLFDRAGGVPVTSLARWDGKAWSAVGQALLPAPGCGDEHCLCRFCTPVVFAAASFDDGSGPALYVGGGFQAPGVPSGYIARFHNGQWEAAGTLFPHYTNPPLKETRVNTLQVLDSGQGPALYAGGTFMTYDPSPKDLDGGCAARWDPASQSWTDLDANPEVKALTVFDDGSGKRLWVGGPFGPAGMKTPGSKHPGIIGTFGADGWKGIWKIGAYQGALTEIAAFDDGRGPAVYLGGDIGGMGDLDYTDNPSFGIVRWDGRRWSGVGTWADIDPLIDSGMVLTEDIVDLGDGPNLYGFACLTKNYFKDGVFLGIVRWDGEHWSEVGQDPGVNPSHVLAYNDGTGPMLYLLEGYSASAKTHIFRLENGAWTTWVERKGYGSGIYAGLDFDDGTGPALWIGGGFLGQFEGVLANFIVRYRPGAGWESVGEGMDDLVISFAVWDDGNGPALYTSGLFTHADGKPMSHIARWDGQTQSWKPVGGGVGGNAGLVVWDDGTGSALWAYGSFHTAGGKPADYIAKWDGKAWSALTGAGTNGGVQALGADLGNGPTLFMTGEFTYANNYPSGGFAAYEFCPREPCPADLDSSGSLDLFDFLTFLNLFNAQDPRADCDGDSAFTLADFTCYTALFAAGCP